MPQPPPHHRPTTTPSPPHHRHCPTAPLTLGANSLPLLTKMCVIHLAVHHLLPTTHYSLRTYY